MTVKTPQRPTTTHEVLAIRSGTHVFRKSHLYHQYAVYEEPDIDVQMDYFFYVLDDGHELRIVDTGFSPEQGRHRNRTLLNEPRQALAQLGRDPAEVTSVVVTHLHYDHIGNLDCFPNATLFVPRREVEFYASDVSHRPVFDVHVDRAAAALIDAELERGRVELIDGISELADGITAISVGGHSPGQQAVAVATPSGPVVLASDAIHTYEEIDKRRPYAVFTDLEGMFGAYELIASLADGAVVVPGHDADVMNRFPAIDHERPDLGVRLSRPQKEPSELA